MASDVLVIGGGAAGMMAAITAARAGKSVILLEKNDRLGKKLLITGKGRCNVTNDCTADEVLKNTPRNGKFLFSAMAAFPPEQAMRFFEDAGCALKTERGNRVFPITDRSQTVLEALQRELKNSGVIVKTARVLSVERDETGVIGAATNSGFFEAKKVILATGGASYPTTGSTGDGYKFAKSLGHTIVEPQGSLVPLETAGTDAPDMQGLALKNVAVKLLNPKGKAVYKDFGEMLFTHFGISGPTVPQTDERVKNVVLKEAGTLETHFTNDEKEYVTKLVISGPINSEDIKFLRKMAGAFQDNPLQSWQGGSLRILDLENAKILKDNEPYLVEVAKGGWTSVSYLERSGFKYDIDNKILLSGKKMPSIKN